jgi:hypothetical protein
MSKGDMLTIENTCCNDLIAFEHETQCRLCFTTDCWGCTGERTCLCECNGRNRDEELDIGT